MSTPGLLYVNSCVTQPAHLSPETFTDWYEHEHIPDILATSGIKSAFRYKSNDPETSRPYLACYPLESLEFLQTAEFKSIPVHSTRYLPRQSNEDAGCIFGYADFDTRYYQMLSDTGRAMITPAPWLVSVCSAEPYGTFEHSALVRRRDYRLTFAGQNGLSTDQKRLADPPPYLSIFVFSEEPQGADFLSQKGTEVEVKQFGLLKAFHKME